MAGRKKQEISLQVEVNTQEEWEDIMQKEGLYVVDVFQEWSGPCKAMTGLFRRIKNETGDDLLNFAIAKADTIDALERYRGKCEPCFLIYGGGALVATCRGANPPILEKLIRSKLAEEHRVMLGEMERKEIRDPFFAQMEEEEKRLQEELQQKENEIDQEVTIAIIKPDAVQNGKVDEILQKLDENGIEILAQKEHLFTDDEARAFYSHLAEEAYFEKFITYMTSGPVHCLVLAKGDLGIIDNFKELLGPKDVDDAKAEAPESLRALYGTVSYQNGLHGSESAESALKELKFFFPDFVIPRVMKRSHEVTAKVEKVERTLAIIRPEAYNNFKDAILQKIEESGFTIAMQKVKELTREDVEILYEEQLEQPYFEELVKEMTKGPSLALALARENAVSYWRQLLGPTDPKQAKEETPEALRSIYSVDTININLIHGSDSKESANRELEFFFPIERTVAVIKPDAYENREEIIEKIKEGGFHIASQKEILMRSDLVKEFYRDQADKDFFNDLVDHMCSGKSVVLLLTREDAIQGWREFIGETDPALAAEKNLQCLRAVYGRNIRDNALHGSSNVEHAEKSIELIFKADSTSASLEGKDSEQGTTTKHGSEKKEKKPAQEGEAVDGKPEQPTEENSSKAETAEKQEEQSNKKEQDKEKQGTSSTAASPAPPAKIASPENGSRPTSAEKVTSPKPDERPASSSQKPATPKPASPKPASPKPDARPTSPGSKVTSPKPDASRPTSPENKKVASPKPAGELGTEHHNEHDEGLGTEHHNEHDEGHDGAENHKEHDEGHGGAEHHKEHDEGHGGAEPHKEHDEGHGSEHHKEHDEGHGSEHHKEHDEGHGAEHHKEHDGGHENEHSSPEHHEDNHSKHDSPRDDEVADELQDL